MGFGSYDESEQQQPEMNDEDEDAAVSVHEHDHDGEMTVETGASTDDLIGQLQDMKETDEE
ncbi:hypothetical protein C479_12012 [Halovivax asiaticus JCM 14624]|uniref:DUF5786 domain-containing protein n=1 Tax=Halovivax asiaticus JCM 14624 TaxID=1227490 RepID=M0BE57_9EURY|nr:DUF5786 family protein [Halovivax asiaticus]ELZ09110.1 hypothetical protein C479_12012 [Halovivax asiaticus JCM 14624]